MRKPIYLITIILLLIIAFAFYWYEWRPSQIIKECYHKIYDNKALDFSAFKEEFTKSGKQKNESEYENCLLEKGLEK